MKKFLIVLGLVSLTACGKVDNVVNNFKSTTGMLDRKVTLLANDGHAIKTWETKNEIIYVGPIAGFVDVDGNNVRISGTFIIEGK